MSSLFLGIHGLAKPDPSLPVSQPGTSNSSSSERLPGAPSELEGAFDQAMREALSSELIPPRSDNEKTLPHQRAPQLPAFESNAFVHEGKDAGINLEAATVLRANAAFSHLGNENAGSASGRTAPKTHEGRALFVAAEPRFDPRSTPTGDSPTVRTAEITGDGRQGVPVESDAGNPVGTRPIDTEPNDDLGRRVNPGIELALSRTPKLRSALWSSQIETFRSEIGELARIEPSAVSDLESSSLDTGTGSSENTKASSRPVDAVETNQPSRLGVPSSPESEKGTPIARTKNDLPAGAANAPATLSSSPLGTELESDAVHFSKHSRVSLTEPPHRVGSAMVRPVTTVPQARLDDEPLASPQVRVSEGTLEPAALAREPRRFSEELQQTRPDESRQTAATPGAEDPILPSGRGSSSPSGAPLAAQTLSEPRAFSNAPGFASEQPPVASPSAKSGGNVFSPEKGTPNGQFEPFDRFKTTGRRESYVGNGSPDRAPHLGTAGSSEPSRPSTTEASSQSNFMERVGSSRLPSETAFPRESNGQPTWQAQLDSSSTGGSPSHPRLSGVESMRISGDPAIGPKQSGANPSSPTQQARSVVAPTANTDIGRSPDGDSSADASADRRTSQDTRNAHGNPESGERGGPSTRTADVSRPLEAHAMHNVHNRTDSKRGPEHPGQTKNTEKTDRHENQGQSISGTESPKQTRSPAPATSLGFSSASLMGTNMPAGSSEWGPASARPPASANFSTSAMESTPASRGSNGQQIVLRLSSQGLSETSTGASGEVRVILKVKNGVVQARIMPQTPQRPELETKLRESLPELRQALARHGFETSRIEFITRGAGTPDSQNTDWSNESRDQGEQAGQRGKREDSNGGSSQREHRGFQLEGDGPEGRTSYRGLDFQELLTRDESRNDASESGRA